MQPLKDEEEKNAEWLGLTQLGEQGETKSKAGKRGRVSLRGQKMDPLLPGFPTHSRKSSPRKRQWTFQERRKFEMFWQRLLEERIFGGEFGIIVQIKPFTAGMFSPSSSPCIKAPLQCPGSEQELLNEFKCCWGGKYLPSEPAKLTLGDVWCGQGVVKGAPKLGVRTARSWILGGWGT